MQITTAHRLRQLRRTAVREPVAANCRTPIFSYAEPLFGNPLRRTAVRRVSYASLRSAIRCGELPFADIHIIWDLYL